MTDQGNAAASTEPVVASLADVQVTRYDHGGARFFIEDDRGRHLFADTYNATATDFLAAALKEAESDA